MKISQLNFTNALMIAVLAGIVDIATRQDRMEKRLMSRSQQIFTAVAAIGAALATIAASNQEIVGDIGELKTKLEEEGASQEAIDALTALETKANAVADSIKQTAEIVPEPATETPTDPTDPTEGDGGTGSPAEPLPGDGEDTAGDPNA